MSIIRRAWLLFWLAAPIHHVPCFAEESFGKFIGAVATRWLDDGRRMELLADFQFVDRSNVAWTAPRGWIIDGASIPQIAWSIAGGPFEGPYRDASVIHDVACDQKARTWEAVHLAFHDAMRARGVGPIRAKLMYAAVYAFGPRWPSETLEVVSEPELSARIENAKLKLGKADQVEISIRDHYLESVGLSGQKERLPTGLKELRIITPAPSSKITAEEFQRLKDQIEREDLSVEQIRQKLRGSN